MMKITLSKSDINQKLFDDVRHRRDGEIIDLKNITKLNAGIKS